MFLENNIIKLRAPEPEDLELLYEWENDPSIWLVSNTRGPYSRFQLRQYLSEPHTNIYDDKQLRLMIDSKNENKTIGTVDLFDFDPHNERIALGLYVASSYQGNGFAKEALYLTEEYVFKFLKINQLYVHIADGNTASTSMFRKEHFEHTGTLKNWIKNYDSYSDLLIFQQFRNDYLNRKTSQ